MSQEFTQESFFVDAKQSGQFVARDFNESYSGLAVPIVEHYLHLQNVITALAELSMARGFLSSVEPSERSYGQDIASEVRTNVENKIPNIVALAEAEFAKATGYNLLADADTNDQSTKSEQREMYSRFLVKYRFPAKSKEAVKYRKELIEKVELFSVTANTQVENIQNGTQENTVATDDLEMAQTPHKSIEKMPSAHDRIVAIHEDPRAGFLPYTHLEKNTVLTYLDYIDSPRYLRGVSNQLLEVFHHQQKKQGSGMKDGRRAIESIVYEVGDFLTNARQSLMSLTELREIVDNCPAPHAKIMDEAGPEHLGYYPLLRYIDSVSFLKNAKVEGLSFDHMQTKETRWARGNETGKHKIVQDQYTREESYDLFKDRISDVMGEMTVKHLRRLIADACNNEDARLRFYESRLNDFKKLPESQIFTPIRKTIDQLLEGTFVTNVTVQK